MDKIIFHIDVNSAYLSWTAIKLLRQGAEVDIRKIPSIIGGSKESRHGIVLAKSIPAKQFNVKTGEPIVNALQKCPNLEMVLPDHEYYAQQSGQFISLLSEFTSDIEKVSIDECYIDFTNIRNNFSDGDRTMSPVEAAAFLKDEIYKNLGFTVNIGVSCNKLLAKMASDFKKPNLVHTLFPEEIEKKMWPMPVGKLYMVGKSSVRTLDNLGIKTIGDLAGTSVKILESHLKSHGRLIWEFANGIDDTPIHPETEQLKGVGNSTTLSKDVENSTDAKKVLLDLAENVARRLREYRQKSSMISVEIKYNDFSKVSHQTTLNKSTDVGSEIYETSCQLFDKLWNGTPIRLLGIRTAKLQEYGEPEQITIFDMLEKDGLKYDKQRKADEAMDLIRKKYGNGAVTRASLLKE